MTSIVHVISSLTTGGAEMSLLRLCREQVKRYNQVTVISLQPQSELYQQFINANVKVVCLNMTNAGQVFSTLLALRNAIKKASPDIVHSWMYYSNFLVSLACTGFPQPVIWAVRRTEVPAKSIFSRMFMKSCALLSHFAPSRVCYNAHAGIKAHEGFGYARAKSVFIANGFDFESAAEQVVDRLELRSRQGLDNNVPVVLCVARWHSDKGQDLLIEALSIVKQDFDTVKLVLVGRGCDINNSAVSSQLEKFSVGDNVILVGEQLPVEPWFGMADLYCMPSRTEGFPNALVEAMALDLPCVATDVGDVATIVEEGVYLVEPEPQALAQAIISQLARSQQQRLINARKAGAKIRKRFAITEITENYDKLYRKVLESL